jgi:hypothetical protein
MTSEVWAIDLLPVVRKKAPGVPGPARTFSDAQITLIIHMREKLHKEWGEIARAVNRPLPSVHRQYKRVVAERKVPEPTPASLSAAVPHKPNRLHEELGIRTYTIERNALDNAGKAWGDVKRLTITLSAGIARCPE